MDNTLNIDQRNEIIMNNMGLVINVVKSFYATRPSITDDFNDLVSVGTLGLFSAVSSFDASKGVLFGTYATTCIENSLKLYYRRNRKYSYYVTDSLNNVIATNPDGVECFLEDIIESEINIEDSYIQNYNICYALNAILNTLSSKQKLTFLFDLAGIPQHEIGDLLGFSQSNVSKIIKSASKKVICSCKSRVPVTQFCASLTQMYEFKILDEKFYHFKINSSNIKKCMNSTRFGKTIANLENFMIKQNSTIANLDNFMIKHNSTIASLDNFMIKHDSNCCVFQLPRIDYAFFIIGCIVYALEF